MAKSIQNFFSEEQKTKIVNAVKAAEKETSGEVRVHIDKKCKSDVLDCAAFVFEKLEMHNTELRNGVLFYLSIKNRKFAILGDAGINAKVPDNFWDDVKIIMDEKFDKDMFTEGLIEGIRMAGEKLKKFFPYQLDDVNELPDDISFG